MNKSGDKYYRKFGMDRDPFPTTADSNHLYLTPVLNLRLRTIKSLIETTDRVLVISSIRGMGKTALSEHLESIKEASWQVTRATANAEMSPEALAYELIQQFIPDYQEDKSRAISFLHKQLELSSKNNNIPIIIIDNTHILPIETLKFILQLAELRYNETLFRFVLFGDEIINDRFETPALKTLSSGMLQSVYLPSFNQEHTSAYIKNRLSSSGKIEDFPFSDEDIKYIYDASGGVPGGINLLARELLIAKTKSESGNSLNRLLAIVMILVITLVPLYFLYLHPQSGAVRIVEVEKPVTAKIAPEQENKNNEAPVMSYEFPSDERLSLKLSELPFTAHQESAPIKQVATTINNSVKQSPPMAMPSEQETLPDSEDTNWLRQQPIQAYVLQLISAREMDSIKNMATNSSQGSKRFASFVTYTKTDEPRYILVYGTWPDLQAAKDAIPNLPDQLKAVNPWPRSIASILNDLDKSQ